MFMPDLQSSIARFIYGSGTIVLNIPQAVQSSVALVVPSMEVATPRRVSTFFHGHFTGVLPKSGAAFP
jgi:hypothetical protein